MKSVTPMGPLTPATPQWMCAAKTFSMFATTSRNPSSVPRRVQPEGRDASGKGVPSRHLVAAREHGAERGRLGRHRRPEDADEQPSHQGKDDRSLHDSPFPVARTGQAAT